MKRLLTYTLITLGILLLALSCSQAEVAEPGTGGETGTLTLRVTGSRADDGAYDPFDHLTLRIFNGQGTLVRKYTSMESIPASLELLADEYRITVEAGDRSAATFTNKSYYGENTFTITAGATSSVEVVCKLINTAAQVKFDATVAANFGTEFKAQVCAIDAYDASAVTGGTVPTLEYTSNKTGYFILPEGVHNLSWAFIGTHPKHGEIIKTGVIEDVQPGYRYTVSLRYSPDLPGYIDLTLQVDTSTDDWDDTIIFSPEPTINGTDFDMTQLQKYTSGEKTFEIASIGILESIEFEFAGATYNAFDYLEDAPAPSATRSESGIVTRRTSDYNVTVTLSDAFFSGKPAGNTPLKFQIKDADGGILAAETEFRLQGMMPVVPDMWHKAVSFQIINFDENASALFSLRGADGDWIETQGIRTGDVFSADFYPTWIESTNDADLTVYTIQEGTGLALATDYEYKVAFDGTEVASGSFSTPSSGQPIPNGDMEGDLPCFTKSGSETTTFWGSGNAATSGLCAVGTKAGMGGNQCAFLSAQVTLGNLAAGNLFSATFRFASLAGTVSFGMPYTWTIRPKALRVKYHATVGTVNKGTASDYEYIKDGHDRSRIFVAIVDWSSRHNTTSSLGSPSGVWDPAKQTSVSEGAIIGYGSLLIRDTTPGDEMVEVELPISFYDKLTRPTGNYSLVISCATSAYGDYKVGCDTNKMYVDDFEWVY